MSKSIKNFGSTFGIGSPAVSGEDRHYLNYLGNYNTENQDKTIQNMDKTALGLSENLGNRPDYVYQVDGSDAARQRQEEATYLKGLSALLPQYEENQSSLETRLQNQGLAVGSEAYEKAMGNLYSSKNTALNQLALDSISAGQDSFSQSLTDEIDSANFQNTARELPLNEIITLLSKGVSGYNNMQNLYTSAADTQTRNRQYNNDTWDNYIKGIKALK